MLCLTDEKKSKKHFKPAFFFSYLEFGGGWQHEADDIFEKFLSGQSCNASKVQI